MLINYDVEKIKNFLQEFHNITGLTLSIWDTEINQLGHEPEQIPEFCALVKSSPLGRARCLCSDKRICSMCCDTLSPVTLRCHAGLTDTAVPIILGEKLLGFVMFGQIQGDQDDMLDFEYFKKLGNELSLPPEKLYRAYRELTKFDMNKILSASKILTASAPYLFNSGYIWYSEHELLESIDKYIIQNITEQISVHELCRHFGISKTRLYCLFHNHFELTIGQYILTKRMELARKLLLSSDTKINEICRQVGIPDYNYFTKVFKKYYGSTPTRYKRNNR